MFSKTSASTEGRTQLHNRWVKRPRLRKGGAFPPLDVFMARCVIKKETTLPLRDFRFWQLRWRSKLYKTWIFNFVVTFKGWRQCASGLRLFLWLASLCSVRHWPVPLWILWYFNNYLFSLALTERTLWRYPAEPWPGYHWIHRNS
jgi:hypothetical protein